MPKEPSGPDQELERFHALRLQPRPAASVLAEMRRIAGPISAHLLGFPKVSSTTDMNSGQRLLEILDVQTRDLRSAQVKLSQVLQLGQLL